MTTLFCRTIRVWRYLHPHAHAHAHARTHARMLARTLACVHKHKHKQACMHARAQVASAEASSVCTLREMGFGEADVRRALDGAGGDVQRAANWLLSL